jgi:plastocyanin
LKARARVGISRIALVAALVVVVAVAGVAVYLASAPSARSTSNVTSSTTSASPVNVTVAVVPPAPWISPGETQNYTLIEVSAGGSGLGGALTISVFLPKGLSLVLNQTSVPLVNGTQSIPTKLEADPGLPPGNYSVTVETGSSAVPARNQTFTVQVVQMLVVMQDVGFHPQNVTVAKGTRVTWLNLDTTIGCCDPGNHDVSFTSGANATSPILKRYQSWSYVFGADGVASYYCTIHPFMKGTVTVAG